MYHHVLVDTRRCGRHEHCVSVCLWTLGGVVGMAIVCLWTLGGRVGMNIVSVCACGH